MPDIAPFHAYRYNKNKVKKYESVLTPPYDVISQKEQDALYKKSPYNFVRIDLRKDKSKTNGSGKKYLEASNELNSWIQKQVFLKEETPSVYVYEQVYTNLSNKKVTRIGFLSLMKINPSRVKKHENTLLGPKKDRTLLMSKMKAQLSPIMGFFQDKSGKIQPILKKTLKKKPVINVKMNGVEHRLYVEDNAENIKEIQKHIKSKNMYIADGHHRFEVASQFKKINPKLKGAQYILTYLCDADRNDFVIYPTHRVLSKLDRGWEKIFDKVAEKYFDKKEYSSLVALEKALKNDKSNRVSMGVSLKNVFLKLTLKKKTKHLDVSVLQDFFIKKLLSEEVAKSKRIQFTRDAKGAAQLVKQKKADIAFYLSNIPIDEMIRISDENIKLPQKSTYFYPKLLSGLVFYKY